MRLQAIRIRECTPVEHRRSAPASTSELLYSVFWVKSPLSMDMKLGDSMGFLPCYTLSIAYQRENFSVCKVQ
jgi:hypothetical protein